MTGMGTAVSYKILTRMVLVSKIRVGMTVKVTLTVLRCRKDRREAATPDDTITNCTKRKAIR